MKYKYQILFDKNFEVILKFFKLLFSFFRAKTKEKIPRKRPSRSRKSNMQQKKKQKLHLNSCCGIR